jgi:NADPH:quinone reductase-like Zn-dependent oxidoreductase
MKAIHVDQFSDGFDQVKVIEQNKPSPGPGEILVRMQYAPINPSDLNYIHGTYSSALEGVIWNAEQDAPTFDPERAVPCPQPPYILGGEGVGIVEATGSGLMAKRLKGKRVAIVGSPIGTWGEYAVTQARRALPVPDNVDSRQAAMSFVNPLTAYIMLREVLKVQPGDWVLQSAAASALGKIVIKLSKVYGFKTINVIRNDGAAEQVRALGGDAVINQSMDNIQAEVSRLTNGRGVSHALDCVGGQTGSDFVQCLGLDGSLLCYGTLSPDPIILPSRYIMMPVARVEGFFLPNWMAQQNILTLLKTLRNVKKLSAQGHFEVPVSETVTMDNIQAGLKAATTPGRGGKILIELGT